MAVSELVQLGSVDFFFPPELGSVDFHFAVNVEAAVSVQDSSSRSVTLVGGVHQTWVKLIHQPALQPNDVLHIRSQRTDLISAAGYGVLQVLWNTPLG